MSLPVGRQKIFGLGYALLIFVYEKTDDPRTTSSTLNILHTVFVEPHRTGDFQMTRLIRQMLENEAIAEDLVALADVEAYERSKHLEASNPVKWRSGIKHDCSKVMELTKVGARFVNAFGETASLEDAYLYPMFKSSDVANGNTVSTSRWMIVPQQAVGEDTTELQHKAPCAGHTYQNISRC